MTESASIKVLVADNDPIYLQMVPLMLSGWGFEAVTADNGEDAWRLISSDENMAMAIIEWNLPGMHGLEICRRVQQLERHPPVYVMMLTNQGDKEKIVEGINAGANDYVTKPFDVEEMQARMSVGRRVIELDSSLIEANRQLTSYASEMEKLAEQRAQQLIHAERMATVGVMSAGIAHEINNPTMFISANLRSFEKNWPAIKESLDYARPKIGDDEADFVLEDMPKVSAGIKRGIERTKKIVDALRTYSRQEPSTRKLVNVEECIDQALEICQNRVKYNVTIERPQPNPSLQAKCDPQQIEQIFVNLLVNATDAIEGHKGTGAIEITAEEGADCIRIKFVDNGPGIPEDKIDDLFKPFYTTKEVGKGTGLGLAICQNIAVDHDGSLTVKNRPQGGAEFTLELPLRRDML
jgi:two-component system NtrC family sensor kinase